MRRPSPRTHGAHRPGALAYLTQLVAWGCTASEVEQILLDGTKQSDEPDEDTEEDEDTETFEEVHADEEELMAEELTAE